jgi:hypothetical protein
MSKHSSAEDKLHLSKQLRGRSTPTKDRLLRGDNAAPQVPPKGTNANNQFR